MIAPRCLEIGDDCVGQHMTRRPEYNGMVGTIDKILIEEISINGQVAHTTRRYLVLWADGAMSLQHGYQLRLPTMAEEAFAYACAAEVLLRVQ